MKRKKVTLQYKCRRCGARYYDPTLDYLLDIKQIHDTSSLMTAIHDCHDNDEELRYGIADLIGCKVE